MDITTSSGTSGSSEEFEDAQNTENLDEVLDQARAEFQRIARNPENSHQVNTMRVGNLGNVLDQINNMPENQEREAAARSSGRQRRPPGYLGDYVTKRQ